MNTEEFIKQASADPELCQKMAACTTPEEAYANAQLAGVADSYERFCEVMQAARDQVSELSEDDLENLNAATGDATAMTIAISIYSSSVVAAAAAGV